jgi:S1-C subfamily serine protease
VGNGNTYRASVAGYDQGKDIAVLKLSGATGLQTVTIARSAKIPWARKSSGSAMPAARAAPPATQAGRSPPRASPSPQHTISLAS